MDELFQCFIKEARFIRNLTPKTISTYQQAWTVYSRYCTDIDQQQLTLFVMSIRERGISPSGCNSYIRSINSFLSWLHTNGHTKERLHIKLLKVE